MGCKVHLEHLPIIAAVSPSIAGGQGGPDHFLHTAAGPITRGDISAMYPYPNQICGLVVSGQIELNYNLLKRGTYNCPCSVD